MKTILFLKFSEREIDHFRNIGITDKKKYILYGMNKISSWNGRRFCTIL